MRSKEYFFLFVIVSRSGDTRPATMQAVVFVNGKLYGELNNFRYRMKPDPRAAAGRLNLNCDAGYELLV